MVAGARGLEKLGWCIGDGVLVDLRRYEPGQDAAGTGAAGSETARTSRLNTWSLAAECVPTTQL